MAGFKFSLISVFVLVLVACGGGGGGGSSSPTPAPNPPTNPLGAVESNAQEQLRLYAMLASEFVVPDHAVFRTASIDLSSAFETFCSAPDSASMGDLQTNWQATMDAWQRIQWLRTGPIEQNNRRFRIQFFPDANSAVTNGVDQMLAGSELIDEARIATSSVGVQGLPALEYLLFSIGNLSDPVSGARRCELGLAVAANLVSMAAELADEWSVGGISHSDFTSAAGRFIDGDGVLTEILESLAVQVEFIADRKLGDALLLSNSASLELVWARSSASALLINLDLITSVLDDSDDSSYRLNDYLERIHQADSVTVTLNEFSALARSGLIALEAGLEDILDDQASGDLESIRQALQELADAIENAAISAGVTIGFNNLDGD